MAKPRKLASGKWRVEVWKRGVRDSQVFLTKREAESWAARREIEIEDAARTTPANRHTLADVIRRYLAEVAPAKKGERFERLRLNAFLEAGHPLFSMTVGDVQPADIAAWRDTRAAVVKPGSVLRELTLLSAVFEAARRDWRWLESNPVHDVRKPPVQPHRDVVISRAQIKAMCRQLGYRRGPVRSVTQACAVCFLVALRTGARAGELTSLRWESVRERSATVDGKTGKRDIPITRRTRRLLDQVAGFDRVLVFGVGASTLDTLFRRARAAAGLSGFTFHDSRHTAATWLAPRIDVLTLCKIFGWSNPKMAMVYVNPTADEIADRLE